MHVVVVVVVVVVVEKNVTKRREKKRGECEETNTKKCTNLIKFERDDYLQACHEHSSLFSLWLNHVQKVHDHPIETMVPSHQEM